MRLLIRNIVYREEEEEKNRHRPHRQGNQKTSQHLRLLVLDSLLASLAQ